MASLKVPLALNQNQILIRAEVAEKEKSYFCPQCGEHLVLRRGEVKIPHFAHPPSQMCNEQTIIHKLGKLLVQQAVRDAQAELASPPKIERQCEICGGIVAQLLPRKVEDATLEVKLACGYVVDVALIVGGRPRAAVEIRVTHPVDDNKAENLSVPFIELDGYEVVKNPMIWKSIQSKSPKPLICNKCEIITEEFEATAKKVAEASSVLLPTSYYRYGLCPCYKCRHEILVFTYPGHQADPTLPPLYRPIPRTLQFLYSQTVGSKYWMNICSFCGAKQGDFFLYHEPDMPFFAFDCGDDSGVAYRMDMLNLAHYASEQDWR